MQNFLLQILTNLNQLHVITHHYFNTTIQGYCKFFFRISNIKRIQIKKALKTFIIFSPFLGDDAIPTISEPENSPTTPDFSSNSLLGHLSPEDFRELQEIMWFYGHMPEDGSYKSLYSV